MIPSFMAESFFYYPLWWILRTSYSTETALTKVTNNLFVNKQFVFILFGFHAAFLHCQLICSSLNKLFFWLLWEYLQGWEEGMAQIRGQ